MNFDDLLSNARVEAWKDKHPRQWWAFENLKAEDDLRERVVAAILNDEDDEVEAFSELARFTDALEAFKRSVKDGTVKPPPGMRERRDFPILVSRMTMMETEKGRFFRVDFSTPEGWGGHFDTTNPSVVEKISKWRHRANPLTIVGEIIRRPYRFYVELDSDVHIV